MNDAAAMGVRAVPGTQQITRATLGNDAGMPPPSAKVRAHHVSDVWIRAKAPMSITGLGVRSSGWRLLLRLVATKSPAGRSALELRRAFTPSLEANAAARSCVRCRRQRQECANASHAGPCTTARISDVPTAVIPFVGMP